MVRRIWMHITVALDMAYAPFITGVEVQMLLTRSRRTLMRMHKRRRNFGNPIVTPTHGFGRCRLVLGRGMH